MDKHYFIYRELARVHELVDQRNLSWKDLLRLCKTPHPGQRKQSIRDVEVLFSESMEQFMLGNGYTFEAQYIRVIYNWRRACDERGLSELQRCRYNYDLLLDDLMPWHKECYDFSLLEVNRYAHVCTM